MFGICQLHSDQGQCTEIAKDWKIIRNQDTLLHLSFFSFEAKCEAALQRRLGQGDKLLVVTQFTKLISSWLIINHFECECFFPDLKQFLTFAIPEIPEENIFD